ncbi:MAG: hypothetical protein JNK45_02820 [Myxococcales bacterium]|nr:hypothetical protein [Myxococcales bacterium]
MITARPRLALTFCALGLFAVVGCKGGGAATGKYIPEAATIVGGVDLAGVQDSKLWKDHIKGLVEAQGKEALDAMNGCNLGLDKWKSVTFGATAEGGGDKLAFVVVADGIGKKDNLECAFTKIKESDEGKDPWTVKEDGKVLELPDGQGTAYVIDDNTMAVAGKDWAADVAKLTKGEGKSVFDGALKDVIGRTDTGKQVWFAGALPEAVGGKAAGQLGATPKDVAGYVDFSSGMAVKASVGVASKDEAEAVKTKVEGLYNAVAKDMAKGQGISEDTLNSVKFGTDGAAFTFEAKASDEEIGKSIGQFMPKL